MTFVLKTLVQNDRLRRLRLQAQATEQQQQQQQQQSQQPLPVVAEIPLQPSSTVTPSILRCASQEVMQRPHGRRTHFPATHDTTCVYPKGLALPLAAQKTRVFNGASKLRPSTRHAAMELYGRVSQTASAAARHVEFDPAVKAEAGLATSTLSRYLTCRILRPILEEEGRKRGRSIDGTAETDAALVAIEPKSKRFCLRAEIASQVHRGIKRKCDNTAIAENDEALERKSKRARICAAGSEVAEVSRFIDCSLFLISLLCLFSSSQSDIPYCSIHFFFTIMSCRLSQLPRLRLLLRTSPLR